MLRAQQIEKRRRQGQPTAGLGCRQKHFCPGKRYQHQRVAGVSKECNPVHSLSGLSTFTVNSAYQRSKLVSDGDDISDIVPNTARSAASNQKNKNNTTNEVIINEDSETDPMSSIYGTSEDTTDSATSSSQISHVSAQQIKYAVAYQFTNILNSPPESEWDTKYTGTVSKVIDALKLDRHKRGLVRGVFKDILLAESVDKPYLPDRKYSNWSDSRRLIPSTSAEYQLIGDAMEDGHGIRATCELVNEFR